MKVYSSQLLDLDRTLCVAFKANHVKWFIRAAMQGCELPKPEHPHSSEHADNR